MLWQLDATKANPEAITIISELASQRKDRKSERGEEEESWRLEREKLDESLIAITAKRR